MNKDTEKTKVNDEDFDNLLNDLKNLATIPKELLQIETVDSDQDEIDKPPSIDTKSDDIAAISNVPVAQSRMTPRSTKSQSIERPKSFAEFKASITSSEQAKNVFNYNQTPARSISQPSKQQKSRSRSRSVSFSRLSKQENEQKYPLTARSRKSRKERLSRAKSYTESQDIEMANEYVYNYRNPGAVFGFTPRSCNKYSKSNIPPVGLYQPKINGISKSKHVRGGRISQSKRFKPIPKKAAAVGSYTPKWSYAQKPLAKGGTFGQSNRFNKYNRKKNRNYSKNKASNPSNEYIDYNHTSFKSLKSKGGRMSQSRRFREEKIKVPGPGTYRIIHSLNHSRLPYSIPTKPGKL